MLFIQNFNKAIVILATELQAWKHFKVHVAPNIASLKIRSLMKGTESFMVK